VNYTDPSGHCIITGVDTIVCIVALVVGIPIVAGVTTAAWDFALSQAGGLGAENWGQPECINWGQVASAGGSGAVAALEKLLAIPLAPNYLFAAWMGASPTEANTMLLSYVGLDDQYMNLQGNPYYVAGGYGGQASVNYISLAMLYNGLPSFNISSGLQMSGYNSLALSGYNITVSGGSAGLIYTGVAGVTSSSLMMSSNGGGGGDSKILQYGDHTIKQSTLDRLGVTREDMHKALQLIRKENRLSNSFHGNIAENGNYIDPATGRILGNIYHYLP
jgi:hypothetical protein